MSQKYVKVEDAFGGEEARIWVCPNCGGLVLGMFHSKVGMRVHKRCPPRPVFPIEEEVLEE